MDIAAFISELLEHQDELIVPGLGAFYRIRVEGYYSKDQLLFYPPSLQLQFNPDIKDDNGKLIDQIAATLQGDTDRAKRDVDKYIADLLKRAANESVPLGDLGSFSIRRNQLFFLPKKLSNNNELYYGLVPVKVQRNALPATQVEYVPKPAVQLPVTEKPSAFTEAMLRGEPVPSSAPELPLLTEEEVVEKKKSAISTWVLIAALVLLFAGIGLIFAYRSNPGIFDAFHTTPVAPPVSNKNRDKEVSDSIENALKAEKDIGETPKVDSATLAKIIPDAAPVDTFAVVIGTFASLDGAQKEYDRYRMKGLNVEIRKMPDKTRRYQIDIAAYHTLDSANANLGRYKRKLQENDFYVQTYPYKPK